MAHCVVGGSSAFGELRLLRGTWRRHATVFSLALFEGRAPPYRDQSSRQTHPGSPRGRTGRSAIGRIARGAAGLDSTRRPRHRSLRIAFPRKGLTEASKLALRREHLAGPLLRRLHNERGARNRSARAPAKCRLTEMERAHKSDPPTPRLHRSAETVRFRRTGLEPKDSSGTRTSMRFAVGPSMKDSSELAQSAVSQSAHGTPAICARRTRQCLASWFATDKAFTAQGCAISLEQTLLVPR